MSKRSKLRKEYFKQFGSYKANPEHYIKWLEDKLIGESPREYTNTL